MTSERSTYVITNPFGYYTFYGVRSGRSYIVTVTDKRYKFAPLPVTITDDLGDLISPPSLKNGSSFFCSKATQVSPFCAPARTKNQRAEPDKK